MNDTTVHKAAMADALLMIESLELPYLEALQGILAEHIAKRREDAIADAKAKIARIAANVGVPLEELVKEPPKPRKPREPRPPLYRDPATGKTWNGNGPAPKWIKGQDFAAFRITE